MRGPRLAPSAGLTSCLILGLLGCGDGGAIPAPPPTVAEPVTVAAVTEPSPQGDTSIPGSDLSTPGAAPAPGDSPAGVGAPEPDSVPVPPVPPGEDVPPPVEPDHPPEGPLPVGDPGQPEGDVGSGLADPGGQAPERPERSFVPAGDASAEDRPTALPGASGESMPGGATMPTPKERERFEANMKAWAEAELARQAKLEQIRANRDSYKSNKPPTGKL